MCTFVDRRSVCACGCDWGLRNEAVISSYLAVCVRSSVCARVCVLNDTGKYRNYICRKMFVAPSNQKPSCM